MRNDVEADYCGGQASCIHGYKLDHHRLAGLERPVQPNMFYPDLWAMRCPELAKHCGHGSPHVP
jgi:hypothetical protein